MDSKVIKFLIWIILVCLWNFGFPQATPIYDVLAAVALSFISKIKI
tara:strand:- start:163 stop:300 length:138 start_codon:yes stop_codon:yes gene_type:complete